MISDTRPAYAHLELGCMSADLMNWGTGLMHSSGNYCCINSGLIGLEHEMDGGESRIEGIVPAT